MLDDQVRGEIAADGDHRLREIAVGHRATEMLADVGIRVVAGVEREGAAVDDAVELVDDRNAIVERQRAGAGLAEQLDEDRHLHRARRVERGVGLNQQLSRPSSVRNATATSAPLALMTRSISADTSLGRAGPACPAKANINSALRNIDQILSRYAVDLWHRVRMRSCTLVGPRHRARGHRADLHRLFPDDDGVEDQRRRHRHDHPPDGLHQGGAGPAEAVRRIRRRPRRASADPLSEQVAKDTTASIGPGVSYVSSELITTPLGQGREAIYAFTDVSTLRISTQPAAPAGISIKAQGFSTTPSPTESITFTMTHEANGNAMLHIHVPEPNYLDFFGSPKAAEQIGMIKTMLAGARVLLAAEPNGALVKTSSPFVEGQRVTLLDIDLDTVLADETLLPRIQAVAAAPAEAKAVLLAAKGLKINLDPEITIEFTPAK